MKIEPIINFRDFEYLNEFIEHIEEACLSDDEGHRKWHLRQIAETLHNMDFLEIDIDDVEMGVKPK